MVKVATMHLPLNRLFCARCRCARSISEYPFDSEGLRLTTCIYCQYRRKKKTTREQPPQSSQEQPPQNSQEQPPQNDREPPLHASPRYCSSCNQPRQPSEFSRFKTCEICRTTNKKAQYRRLQRGQSYNLQFRSPSREIAEIHLQRWVQQAGEEEVRAATSISKGLTPLPFHKRRPLTVEDYLQEIGPQEKLQQQQQYQQRQQRLEQHRQQRQQRAQKYQQRVQAIRQAQEQQRQEQERQQKEWRQQHPELQWIWEEQKNHTEQVKQGSID